MYRTCSRLRRIRLCPLSRSPRTASRSRSPLCSIVIPCLDEEATIEAVVRGAMQQHYPASRLQILVWDGVGFWLHYRRLEQGSFIWPQLTGEGVIELTAAQLSVLTDGLDWRRVRYAPQHHPRVA